MTSFTETCLCLLEEAYIPIVKRHIKNAGRFTITPTDVVRKLKKEAESLTKEDLLAMLLEDVSISLSEKFTESLRAEDFNATFDGYNINIRTDNEDENLFGHDPISEKILHAIGKQELLLSEIVKKTKENETQVVKRLKTLCDEGELEYRESDNAVFDTKLYRRNR